MKRIKNWDFLYLGIIIVSFLVMVLLITKGSFLYGSKVDWSSQHIALPEYFRTLFYEAKNLFPDFSFNIGAGQNIYNFAYYGLLSPIVLMSYLLPFINMTYFMITASIFVVIISAILMYKFLKKHEFDGTTSFAATFLFVFSASLTLHSHRHIMFILYMPFLIMALFGVDKFFEENKKSLLIISVFLMIMTSFYYSISGILAVTIYGVYTFLKENKEFKLSEFIKKGLSFSIPILISILMSAVLLLPTFATLLSGRSDTTVIIKLRELFLPKVHLEFLLYSAYSLGLTAISLIALISLMFKKKKENLFLGVALTLLLLFSIFIYLLNGGMYIDSKILIPFLPIFTFVSAKFTKDLFSQKIHIKELTAGIIIVFLAALLSPSISTEMATGDLLLTLILIFAYIKMKNKFLFVVPLLLMVYIFSFYANIKDKLVDKEAFLGDTYQNSIKMIENIDDNSFYRSANLIDRLENINRTYQNSNYYHSTVYSSSSNQYYNKFYYDIMNNPIQMRNRSITIANTNLINNIYLGNKYLINNSKKDILGYELVKENNNVYLFQNNNVFPIAYANSNLVNRVDFDLLKYPYNLELFLNSVIVEKNIDAVNDNETNVRKITLDNIDTRDLNIVKNGDDYNIDVFEKTILEYELPDEYQNQILFIRFDMKYPQSCAKGDTYITINGVRNVLTCSSWKYHNLNFLFDYQIGLTEPKLKIEIGKGKYVISNLDLYTLNYSSIENSRNAIDDFIFDKDKTKGDEIQGSINVKQDGYFVINIPYDDGFKFYVDGKQTDYELVNTAFMGFPIKSGHHNITITYEAPFKRVGLLISSIGLVLFAVMILYDKKQVVK